MSISRSMFCLIALHPLLVPKALAAQSGTDVVEQQAYVKASNAEGLDLFGWDVAVSGDRAVVGSRGEESSSPGVNGDQSLNGLVEAGAVYVFTRAQGAWVQEAYIKASHPEINDLFGIAVALSGNTLVVGAPNEDSDATGVGGDELNNSAIQSGAVYVFEFAGGAWSQVAYIKASNSDAGDLFGSSVAIDGDRIVVGATREASAGGNPADNSRSSAGAVYVFVRSGASWTQEAYLKPSNTYAGTYFGGACSISGDQILVGAIGEDSDATGVNGSGTNSSNNSGAAYIFARIGGVWTQEAYLKASNTNTEDRFGHSVAILGDHAVVGAPHESGAGVGIFADETSLSALAAGAAYAFERVAGSWTFTRYIKPMNTGVGHQFGTSVALGPNRLVVGSEYEDGGTVSNDGNPLSHRAREGGGAYVFAMDAGGWWQKSKVRAAYQSRSHFGATLALSGDLLVVGAAIEGCASQGINRNPRNFTAPAAGAAYIFGLHAGSANYCGPAEPNLSGAGAEMAWSGSRQVGSNTFTLHASRLPAHKFGYFISSRSQTFVATPAGALGNLCVGGSRSILRHNRAHEILMSSGAGTFSLTLDLTDMPGAGPVLASETWNFQAWFRDQLWTGLYSSNFSDGLSVGFE